jgi:hypothetical protein
MINLRNALTGWSNGYMSTPLISASIDRKFCDGECNERETVFDKDLPGTKIGFVLMNRKKDDQLYSIARHGRRIGFF